MIWDSPQKLIRQTAFYIAVVSLVMATAFVLIAYFWQQNHKHLVALDQAIPDYYDESVTEFKQALSTAANPAEKFRLYKSMNKTLSGHSSLNRYFDLYNQSFEFLINHHLQQDDHKLALKLANQWKTTQPHNLNAQLEYAQTLSQVDSAAAMRFTEELAKRYFDIPTIQLHYLAQLKQSGQTGTAWDIALGLQKSRNKKPQPGFAFYYTVPESTKLTKITVGKYEYQPQGTQIHFSKSLDVQHLEHFRFDVDGLPAGSVIKNLSIKPSGASTQQKLPIELMHDLRLVGEDLVTTGTDPYLRVLLSDSQHSVVETVLYSISMDVIPKQNNFLDDLIHQINGQYVTDSAQTNFKFTPYGNQYVSPAISRDSKPQNVTIKLGTFTGLKFSDLYLLDEQGTRVTPSSIVGFSSNNGWQVATAGSEHRISFQLPATIQTQNIYVVMELSPP